MKNTYRILFFIFIYCLTSIPNEFYGIHILLILSCIGGTAYTLYFSSLKAAQIAVKTR